MDLGDLTVSHTTIRHVYKILCVYVEEYIHVYKSIALCVVERLGLLDLGKECSLVSNTIIYNVMSAGILTQTLSTTRFHNIDTWQGCEVVVLNKYKISSEVCTRKLQNILYG